MIGFVSLQHLSALSKQFQGFSLLSQENEVQDSSKVAVLLCGHKEMAQSITAQMLELGVDKERILMNF